MKITRLVYNFGRIMLVSSALFVFPIIVALIYSESILNIASYVISGGVLALLSVLAVLLCKKHKTTALVGREGMALAALTWIGISVFGALPSVISGAIPSFTDAFFDSVSGFTTTGATALTTVDTLPKSLLFWRSLSHWVGGLGILAFAIAVLPQKNGKNKEGSSDTFALKAESPGPTFGKLVSKVKFNTRILYGVYLGLTVLEVILLLCGGMSVFDSISNSMSTMGSGGFALSDSGIAGYNSAYIEWVIAVFMLIAGVNFNFFFYVIIRKFFKAFSLEDVRTYVLIIISSTALITANVYSMYQNFGESVRDAFFQVTSIISTTGFATTDFDKWPGFSKVILVTLMMIGGCAGSTAGGIKVSRVIIFVKNSIKEIRHYINPKEITTVRYEKSPLDNAIVTGISAYLVIYTLIYAVSILLVSIDGHDFTTSFTAVAACFNNVGPGLSLVGPTKNFACMSELSKYVLSVDMLLGRLEIFPLLVLMTPHSWKK